MSLRESPDYIVLRLDIEREIPGVSGIDGEWLDRGRLPFLEIIARDMYGVEISPTMDFEVSLDGCVAQVWTVREVVR